MGVIRSGDAQSLVSERERAQRELAATQALFEAAFHQSPVGKLICRVLDDGATEIVMCNGAFAALAGYEPPELTGRRGAALWHPAEEPLRRRMLADARAGRPMNTELRLLHADGRELWTLIVPAAVPSASGETLFLLQALDISERRRFEEQLRHLADHDAVTGLLSRRRFEEELAREVARARRHRAPACLLLLDLDGFKVVNDAFGHSAGDALLAQIGSSLCACLREGDVLARIGGDEFAVILPQTELDGAHQAALKLREAVRGAGRVVREDQPAGVTASIGIATIVPDAPDAEELLVEVDIAMYQAKDAGGDQAAVYERDSGHRDALIHRSRMIGTIREAIREERLVLHAQPVVPLGGARLGERKHELLVRLLADDGSIVAPGAFLHHAERDGMIVEIDRWVLRQAVRLLHEDSSDDLELAVNLSGRTVQDGRIAEDLAEMLAANPIRRGSLLVEVTETAAITNLERAAQLARDLRGLGCRLALDDFGAGFATFYYLKHVAFDVLKIDGDFIEKLPASRTDQLVVRAIAGIAQGLGAELVAERVADQTSVELLIELGVQYGQSFFLGRPAPVEEALAARPRD